MNHAAGSRRLVSVVIRTYNSWPTTRAILPLLEDPRIERILVDSGSNDLPPDIESLVEKVIRYDEKPFSYGGSLNAGVAAASGEWTWVLSSHCIPAQQDVVNQIVKLLAILPEQVTCVLGSTIPLGRGMDHPVSSEVSYTTVQGSNFPGGNPNCLYHTARLRLRPFDDRLVTCEDIEWFIAAQNAGALVAFSRAFPVFYRTRRSVAVMFRKGLNEYRVGKYLGKPRPKIGWRLAIRLARNFAKVLLRRLTLGDFLRKEAYICGWFCAENFLRPFTETDIRRSLPVTGPCKDTDLPGAKSAVPA